MTVDANTLLSEQPEWLSAKMPHWPPSLGTFEFYFGEDKSGVQWLYYSRAGWVGVGRDGCRVEMSAAA